MFSKTDWMVLDSCNCNIVFVDWIITSLFVFFDIDMFGGRMRSSMPSKSSRCSICLIKELTFVDSCVSTVFDNEYEYVHKC